MDLPPIFADWREVRLDIDPGCDPDIIGDMRDIGEIGQFDAVFSEHSLEHLHTHEIAATLEGFRRVLNKGGIAVLIVPDLEDVRPTEEVVYVAPCGPITGLDMYFGHRDFIPGNPHMAHNTGFIRATLEDAMERAGFGFVSVKRDDCFNLIGVGANL